MSIKCDQCDKEFNTDEGLNQHKVDKHGMSRHDRKAMKREQAEMKQKVATSSIKRKKTAKLAVIAAVIVLAVVGAGFFLLKSNTGYVTAGGSSNSIGATNASVVMIEYSDFQCPFCGRFYAETEKQVMDNYVNTGKVKFVYKNFPLSQIHNYAEKAAEAAECAADQGRFWEYHNKLFENQNSLYLNSLKQYAVDLGLNATQFNSCLDSGATQQRVSSDYKEGISSGVSSTPTFFINGVKVEGAQPYSVLKSAIETALRK